MKKNLKMNSRFKALIIAAGRGTRLGAYTKTKPKPLLKVLGIPIIERIILSAKKAGITDFLIVTGYRGDKIRNYLGDGKKYRVKIKYIHNKGWKNPNGVSVLRAKEMLKENFILLMCDHIFHPMKLIKFLNFKLKNNECALCVDRNIINVFDIEDTTKVYVKNWKVISIGKNLKKYNALDTGMFIISPYFFKVLEKSIKNGFYSITDSVREMSKQGKMKAFESEGFWFDIDSIKDLKHAEKKLKKIKTNFLY